MRVLQVSKFFPPVVGGIEAVAFEIAEGLARRGVHGDVLCAHTARRTVREQAAAGYTVTRAARHGSLLSTSLAPALIGRFKACCHDYDLVHVHMPDPLAALALWRARPRSRIVLHWHSDVVRQRISRRLYAPLERWLLQRADAIVATSTPYLEASTTLRPYRAKVEVLPIGISDPAAEIDADEVTRLQDRLGGRRLVLSVGRMTHYKGFDRLIEAAARLPADVQVVVAGAGALLARHRAEVRRRGLADRIVFAGALDARALRAHLAVAEVFCLASTSRAEAYGVALVEAMAMGRPVVATDLAGSGVPWVNRDGVTGLNVPPGDAGALAAALTRLLDDAALAQRLGAAGRQRYLDELSAATMVDRLLGLYRRLLGEPTAPRP